MQISDKTRETLTFIAQVLLPALGTLYFALAGIWDCIPYPEQIVGTITCVDTFLGTLLHLSNGNGGEKYNG